MKLYRQMFVRLFIVILTCMCFCDVSYGPVDMQLLGEYTWARDDGVRWRFFTIDPDSNHWVLHEYYCQENRDTCFREDTHMNLQNITISGTEFNFVDARWSENRAEVTKLTENELVVRYLPSERNDHFDRNRKTLVTILSGDSAGQNRVDYTEQRH